MKNYTLGKRLKSIKPLEDIQYFIFSFAQWNMAGRIWMKLVLGLAALSVCICAFGASELRFEAEEWTEPETAWLKDKNTDDHWNLWSTDRDAHRKWSGGVVLRSPIVKKDRAKPEDGAPPLHTRITGIPSGVYDVYIKVGRTLAVSLDGKNWRSFRGGFLVEELNINDGTFNVWIDDRYVHASNPGAGYYDYIVLSPVPAIEPKPLVQCSDRTRVEEKLDRGLIAMSTGNVVYVGWRLLLENPVDVGFNVYRQAGSKSFKKLNTYPISRTTDFMDTTAPKDVPLTYTVYPVHNGREKRSRGTTCSVVAKSYISLKLNVEQTFQRIGIADLHDGTFLWRQDLGWAIERGTWYSPYIVYDFDGDGRAEVAAKIGKGDPRDRDGRVQSGPEWVVVWDGLTGKECARADWPSREGLNGYSKINRNQLAVAYLDAKTPCLIVLRGTYGTMKVDAYEFIGNALRPLWRYTDAIGGRRFRGQGAHFTHAADIDGDGRDEVLLGSAVIDDNGTPMWSTRLGHPDHFYLGDIDPQRPGVDFGGCEKGQFKGRWVLTADVLGDWREEIITCLPGEIRIYSTTIPASDRRVCLMQDPIYRTDVALVTMGYPQVPMTSYCLEAVSPGLNLTVIKTGNQRAVRIVISAPLNRNVKGRLLLRAEGTVITQTEFVINIPKGGRVIRIVKVESAGSTAPHAAVFAEFTGRDLDIRNSISWGE